MQKELADFLQQHGARRLWSADFDLVGVDAYQANGRIFLVTRYGGGDNDGWDIFVPVSQSILTGITLNALHEYISK